VKPAVPISIAITPTSASMAKGLITFFTATGTYPDGSKKDISDSVTWTSATPEVAAKLGGILVGVNEGTGVITGSLDGIPSPGVTLTVPPALLKSISLLPNNLAVAVGAGEQLTATGEYTDGFHDITNLVTWASATPSVATVSNTGLASG